jgi:peptidoglycan biosynthesis protein MviN/MurJ (putative lipid II flippase)
MGVEGLALALSIAATLEVIGLAWALRRRIESIDEATVLRSALRSGLSALFAGVVMYVGLSAAQAWFADTLANGAGRVLVLLLLTAAGTAAYLLAATLMRSDELAQVRRYIFRRGHPAALG